MGLPEGSSQNQKKKMVGFPSQKFNENQQKIYQKTSKVYQI
jgi:hypothetical protein